MPYKNKQDLYAAQKRYRERKKFKTCAFCQSKGLFETYLQIAPFAIAYICPKCLQKLPEKLIGLPVKFEGKVVGKIISAEVKTK